jgi:hypothetical protein
VRVSENKSGECTQQQQQKHAHADTRRHTQTHADTRRHTQEDVRYVVVVARLAHHKVIRQRPAVMPCKHLLSVYRTLRLAVVAHVVPQSRTAPAPVHRRRSLGEARAAPRALHLHKLQALAVPGRRKAGGRQAERRREGGGKAERLTVTVTYRRYW